jgi:hypothetical protein
MLRQAQHERGGGEAASLQKLACPLAVCPSPAHAELVEAHPLTLRFTRGTTQPPPANAGYAERENHGRRCGRRGPGATGLARVPSCERLAGERESGPSARPLFYAKRRREKARGKRGRPRFPAPGWTGEDFAWGAGARLERRPLGAGWLSDALSLPRTRRVPAHDEHVPVLAHITDLALSVKSRRPGLDPGPVPACRELAGGRSEARR